jgi:RND family efflux transporter MFP subunit
VAQEASRSVRDELAALRIDRSRPPPQPGGRRRALAAAGGVIALLLLAVAGWLALGRAELVEVAYAERSEPGAVAASGPVLSGSGYVVTGDKYISIGVRVPGRVDAYLVDESDRVKAGQPLVRLDDRDYRAALARARAELRVAEATAELRRKEIQRIRVLRSQDVASQAQLDVKENELRVAEAQVAQSRAEIDQADVNLDYTVLRAPTDGVVLAKLKEVGEMAVPGGFAGSGDLIRMANLDDLRAEVDVNEADLSRVSLGQRAQVVPDAFPDRRYPARVVKLYPQVNRQKGTLKVEVGIEAPDEWLRPDMSVRIHFLGEAQPAQAGAALVLAPRAALRSEAGAAFVWVVSGGKVRRQVVTAGAEMGERVVVNEGLLGGEALVVGDASALADGRAVEVDPAGGTDAAD